MSAMGNRQLCRQGGKVMNAAGMQLPHVEVQTLMNFTFIRWKSMNLHELLWIALAASELMQEFCPADQQLAKGSWPFGFSTKALSMAL